MERILFLDPPFFNKNGYVEKDFAGGMAFIKKRKGLKRPVLDEFYASKICELASYKSDIWDYSKIDFRGIDDFCNSINNIESYKYIFVRTSVPTLYNDLEIASQIKKIYPKVLIAVFGPAVKFNLEFLFKYGYYDIIVASEIEAVILKILKGVKPSLVQGCYQKSDASYECKDTRISLVDLKSLPYLPYERAQFKNYKKYISSSRGCPMRCDYCPYTVSQGTKLRDRNTEQVVNELTYYEKIGIDRIQFRDPSFAFNPNRAIEICKGIISRKLKISWDCEAILVRLTDELIDYMARANCKMIRFGIESLSVDVIKACSRNEKLIEYNTIEYKIKKLKEADIKCAGFFVIGFECDTIENILETPEYVNRISLDKVQFLFPNVYPGTKLYDKAVEMNLIPGDKYKNPAEYFPNITDQVEPHICFSKNISLKQLKFLSIYANKKSNYLIIKNRDALKKNIWFAIFSILKYVIINKKNALLSIINIIRKTLLFIKNIIKI